LKEYELLYIVSPRVAVDDVPNTIERVSALVTSSGGEVLSVDDWGRRRMAYPIKHYFEGTYVLTTLRMEPATAAPLEASLIISEEVIRHLLTEGIIPPTNRDRGRPFDQGDDRERFSTRDRPAGETPRAEPGPVEGEPSAAEASSTEAPEQDESDTPGAAPEPAPAAAE
jgi:small subunit ribosomal protein S6